MSSFNTEVKVIAIICVCKTTGVPERHELYKATSLWSLYSAYDAQTPISHI